MSLVNVSNGKLSKQLRFIGFYGGDYDPNFRSLDWDRVCGFIGGWGFNSIRFSINADWILHDPNYLLAMRGISDSLRSHGMYAVWSVFRLLNGLSAWDLGAAYSKSPIPYTPYISSSEQAAVPNTTMFNLAMDSLARALASCPNSLIEVYNEPANDNDYAIFNAYLSNLPATIQVIRNAGFPGVVSVMGDVSFTPGKVSINGPACDLGWAIDHNVKYPNVVIGWHTYYDLLHQYGDFPDSEADIESHVLGTGRVLEAVSKGIGTIMSETGAISPAALQATVNLLTALEKHRISWGLWCLDTNDPWSLTASLDPPAWNAYGQAFADYVKALPIPDLPIPPIIPPVVVGGITLTAVALYFLTL